MRKIERNVSVIDDDDDDDWFLSEEERDAKYYRPKKKNNRKSLLPLFVYQILTEWEGHHFSQSEIIDILERNPYEIKIERKALSRTLHALADSGLGIESTTKEGAWYDPCL